MISDFRSEADENCTLLHYYPGSSGNFLPLLWNNLSVPSLRFKNSKVFFNSWTMKMGPIGCPEMSVRNYHYWLRNNPEECSSQLKTKLMPVSLEIWCTTFIMGHCIYLPALDIVLVIVGCKPHLGQRLTTCNSFSLTVGEKLLCCHIGTCFIGTAHTILLYYCLLKHAPHESLHLLHWTGSTATVLYLFL
jgi:hypothetical protein